MVRIERGARLERGTAGGWRTTLWQLAQVVLSAVLLLWAFPEHYQWWLVFPSIALLARLVTNVRPGRAMWLTAVWAMVFFVPHISWMLIASGTYVAWGLLAASQAFFISFWGLFLSASQSWRWARSALGQPLAAATLWVGVEQLRARVPYGGFPWAKLAYTQVDSPLLAYAPTGGEVAVSGVVVLLSVLAYQLVRVRLQLPGRFLAMGAIILLLAPAILTRLPAEATNGTVEVAGVQGNVEIPMQEAYGVVGQVTGNHLAETEVLAASEAEPDIVIWGEDSIDRDPHENETTAGQFAAARDAVGVPLIAGYQEVWEDGRYNWLAVWQPGTDQTDSRYAKQHPVPWGEYVPLRGISEFLASEVGAIGIDMVGADNPPVLDVTLNDGRQIRIAVGICFEVADEPIIADGVRLGGEFILIPTNNAHFRYSAESTQQLQMLQFRAASFARAGLQVSTNGVSAFVLPDGKIVEMTDKQVPAYLTAQVPLREGLTMAAQLGEAPAQVAMVVALVLGFAALVRHRRSERGQGE